MKGSSWVGVLWIPCSSQLWFCSSLVVDGIWGLCHPKGPVGAAEGRTGRGWRGRGAPSTVAANTQQGTFASDPFCWDVPSRAFLLIAPHPLAEPCSHHRIPPGSIILALEGALWASSPSGGQEDSGCLCSGQSHCLGCPCCWQGLESAEPRASGWIWDGSLFLPSGGSSGSTFGTPKCWKLWVGISPFSPFSQGQEWEFLPFPFFPLLSKAKGHVPAISPLW